METLSEYMLITRHPQQTIILEPCSFVYKSVPPTLKDKIITILRIIGLVLLGLVLIVMVIISVWGIIQWPWMIIFLIAGFLVGGK